MTFAVLTRRLALAAVVAIAALAGGAGQAAQTAIPTAGPITFNDAAAASPYPSTLSVSAADFPGTVDTVKVIVTLNPPWPDDIDLLLVGPGASPGKVILMSDVGGDNGNAITPDTLTFDDAAPNSVSDSAQLSTGSYKPTNGAGDCDNAADADAFSGAPAGPYGSTLADFHGRIAQGTWSLYAVDDCTLANAGATISSWTLQITALTTTGVTLKSFTGARRAQGVELRWRTASEAEALGFNVYRVAAGKSAKVNRTLIRAKQTGTARGGTYTLLDRKAVRAKATYRLQVVTLAGTRAWAANVAVSARR
jgi:hypothetical protein